MNPNCEGRDTIRNRIRNFFINNTFSTLDTMHIYIYIYGSIISNTSFVASFENIGVMQCSYLPFRRKTTVNGI